MSDREYTPYQREVIRRYYENRETIAIQKLGELVSEAYLAEGKKADRVWDRISRALRNAGVDESEVDRIVRQRDLEALARLVSKLT